jgi:hypothetical protein
MDKKIQGVEFNRFCYASIHCPFCGVKVVNREAAESDPDPTNPCLHTLFVAHDNGFEYGSPRIDENLGLTNTPDEDIELPDRGIDGHTDELTVTDAIKFASYVCAPSLFGSYVGFAPLKE